MVFRNGDINDLMEFTKGKTLVCCGNKADLTTLCELFAPFRLAERIDCVAGDEGEGTVTVGGAEKPLVRLESLYERGEKFVVLFTQILKFDEIVGFINSPVYRLLGDTAFYSGGFLFSAPPEYKLPEYDSGTETLIPKVIHYCWFGRNQLSPLVRRCVDSWQELCPDYEIVEWNEDNYDVNQNRFMSEAYAVKKWAFVSDYARLDIIYRLGGVYMDTDVELMKPLDRFLHDRAFCGMEAPGLPALSLPFGAVAGNDALRALRDMYHTMAFVKEDGEYEELPAPVYHATFFREKGLGSWNTVQNAAGFTVYPTDVFSPIFPSLVFEHLTVNTHAVHRYAGTWFEEGRTKSRNERSAKLRSLFDALHGGGLYKIPFFR